VILGFVGVKMIIAEWYHVPIWLSLTVIGAVLTVTIVASLRAEEKESDLEIPTR
jgi:tellurite resistance protein TerC